MKRTETQAKTKPTLRESDLAHFYGGSETIYRHSISRAVCYTEGIQYLAEHGGAYWLLDAIAIFLLSTEMREATKADPRVGSMHFWELTVKNESAKLTASADSPVKPFFEQAIPYTDFPLPEANIWAAWDGSRWVLMLPREY